jgi:hypothetical protein
MAPARSIFGSAAGVISVTPNLICGYDAERCVGGERQTGDPMRRTPMSTQSPRDIAFGGIIAISTMSFLAGLFLMSGIQQVLRHDAVAGLTFLLNPMFAFAGVLHGRRILRQFPREPEAQQNAGNA